MTEYEYSLSDPRHREHYLVEVRKWALFMLTTLRELPNTAEKLTLLRQVDRVKEANNISIEELPAYSGALAVLTNKGKSLLHGQNIDSGYSKEKIMDLLYSNIMRAMLKSDPGQFIKLKDFLVVKNKANAVSDTLARLSKSGH